jgi:hypothetical protein
VEDHLSEQIQGLGDKMSEYQQTYDQELEGYTKNTWFPNLKVPIGAGFYLLVKWVKWLNNGNISGYSAHDGPWDTVYIVPIYTSLLSSNDMPTRPILWWFCGILTRLHPQFLHMVKYMHKMDDWGIAADLLCYCEYNEEYQKINAKIHRLQLDASAVEQDHALCEQ